LIYRSCVLMSVINPLPIRPIQKSDQFVLFSVYFVFCNINTIKF